MSGVVDPTAVGVSSAATSGLSAYGHATQDYGRGREVYHAQSLAEQGRPNSNQTMYNPSAAATSQYDTTTAQAVVEGPSNSVLNRVPTAGTAKQSPSPTASTG